MKERGRDRARLPLAVASLHDLDGLIADRLEEARRTTARLADAAPLIEAMATALVTSLARGGTIFLAGNGGSAADAQHWAAELAGQLYDKGRPPLPAVALTANTSLLTAIANDLGYEHVFARQLEAQARPGDVLIAISTSGNSPNIVTAAQAARRRRVVVLGFTGRAGSALSRESDFCLRAPSNDVARIQECHEIVGHVLCEMVERAFFSANTRSAVPSQTKKLAPLTKAHRQSSGDVTKRRGRKRAYLGKRQPS